MAALLFENGIGTSRHGHEELLNIIKQRTVKMKERSSMEILIVYESSALSARVAETVEFTLRKLKGNNLPFGGIQVILSFDFLQLPPVKNESDASSGRQIFPTSFFCEKDFITFFNNVAEGSCTEQDVTFVRENLTNPFVAEITEVCKKIMCTNEEIYHETIEHYEEMEGEILIFDSEDEGKVCTKKVHYR